VKSAIEFSGFAGSVKKLRDSPRN